MKSTLLACWFLVWSLGLVSAQEGTPAPSTHVHADHAEAQQQEPPMSHGQMPGMQMPGMNMEEHAPSQLPSPHAGSGTGWQPASVPANEWMWMRGGWELMAHGVIFVDYNQQGGPRGAGKAESVNWGMVMEQHKLGSGTILFRQMFSAESLTSPHPGFPELFQTGETYHNEPLVDHQHPHNVFAELSVLYMLPLSEKISWELYGGPSAEPALGPAAYLHRASVSELPLAPLGHHLQDSTHTSFGVVTTGFVIDRVKLEGSAFNGREPNEQRWSIQLAALDSWSGRVSVAPSANWTAQYSIGRLEHPEALEPGSQWRQTASAEYNRPLATGNWATSLVWGRVHKIEAGTNLNSYLLESTLNFRRRNYAFSRLELVDKDELFPEAPVHPAYRIGAYTFGGERDLVHDRAWQLGLGADVTFYSKPTALDAAYGTNPVSFQIFLRMRPGRLEQGHSHTH
ncbi:MAG TPA: hypothetical protein VFE61_07910 [Candidatus Sulfotelmatobacter sp.]|nr:hypothetical protein [Candidatus Sulfotelmatobacter sp.]